MRVFVVVLVQCGDQREGGIQHNGSLDGFVAVDFGRVLPHGVHLQSESTSQATEGQQRRQQEDHGVHGVIYFVGGIVTMQCTVFQRIVIQEDDGENHQDSEQPHLPVAGDAVQENLAQVALAAELREDSCRCAPSTELKIDDVGTVHDDAQDVDNKEDDFHRTLIGHRVAALDGQELQHDA